MADRTFTRPPDKSLEAYKAWINNMARALGVKCAEPTEAEWEAMWCEFWAEPATEVNDD